MGSHRCFRGTILLPEIPVRTRNHPNLLVCPVPDQGSLKGVWSLTISLPGSLKGDRSLANSLSGAW